MLKITTPLAEMTKSTRYAWQGCEGQTFCFEAIDDSTASTVDIIGMADECGVCVYFHDEKGNYLASRSNRPYSSTPAEYKRLLELIAATALVANSWLTFANDLSLLGMVEV